MPALTPRTSPPRNLKRRRAIRSSPEQTVNEYGPDAARTASALAAITNHPDITAEQLQLMSTLGDEIIHDLTTIRDSAYRVGIEHTLTHTEQVNAFWQQELTKQRASFSALEAQKTDAELRMTDAELRMVAMSDEIEQLKTIVEGRALRDSSQCCPGCWRAASRSARRTRRRDDSPQRRLRSCTSGRRAEHSRRRAVRVLRGRGGEPERASSLREPERERAYSTVQSAVKRNSATVIANQVTRAARRTLQSAVKRNRAAFVTSSHAGGAARAVSM